VNAALRDGLARYTGVGIDVRIAVGHGISVSNPTHLSLSRTHVRGRHIQPTCTCYMEAHVCKLHACFHTDTCVHSYVHGTGPACIHSREIGKLGCALFSTEMASELVNNQTQLA